MRQVLANAERVERLCEESYASLYENDGAILAGLGHVWRRVTDLAALDARFQPYLDAREGIKSQLEDLALFLRRYADGIEASPEKLQQIDDRLALLERLKRKYGPSLADVVARREALRAEWNELRTSDDRLAQLERDHAAAVDRYLGAAAALSDARQNAAKRFSRELEGMLGDLAMERTRFEVRFEPPHTGGLDATWTAEGVDVAQFFVSPNPGEELRPLARIVSGGELSRVMLAIKALTFGARVCDGGRRAGADQPIDQTGARVSVPLARRSEAGGTASARNAPGAPGLIFDEIDAGIGGRVADVVGRELHALGSVFQVLCITHLPQIAAYADTHFQIDKRVENNRTVTTVRRLSREGRVDEIARMLGGAVISEGLRASAREMLAERRRFRLDGGEAKGEGKEKGESERTGAQRRKWRGSTS
jgi:DNA repair protein RecN (Recombination protein N)